MRNLKRRAQADGPRTRICAQQPRGIWTNGSESWKANLKTAANLPAICRHFAGITYALPYPVAVIRCGVFFWPKNAPIQQETHKKRTIKLIKMCIKA